MTLRQPSREEIKLLGELSSGSALQEEQILSRAPEWNRLEQSGILPSGAAAVLRSFHPMDLCERARLIVTNPHINQALLRILDVKDDLTALQYILTAYYDVTRDDTSVTDGILATLSDRDSFSPFAKLLSRPGVDSFTCDKAGFLLSALIARAPRGTYTDEQVQVLIDLAVGRKVDFTDFGRLDLLKNILKHDRYRPRAWNTSGVPDLIMNNLDTSKPESLYPAVFCAWLLTFHSELIGPFTQAGGVERICKTLKNSKTEKAVRICIHTLLNCLPNDESVERVIRQDAAHLHLLSQLCVQTLTLLEYEKWRDEELYQEIRDGLATLQHKIKLFSNFDRYCRELATGHLSWSFLHSEKFWHENVMHFEENEFAAVKKLVLLLRSSDPVTLAVVCSDIGEFARLHPTGKKMLQKLKAKETVMMLMSHKERDVSREALLCTQKMMLDKWQAAAAGGSTSTSRR